MSMSPLDIAIHRTFHDWPGGLKAAAAVLRNKANPTTKGNILSLIEARDAMLMTGDLQILHALAAEFGCVVQASAGEPASLMQELLREQAEHGDVARALSEALRDQRITPREAEDIAREGQESIEALQRLVAAARAAAESGGNLAG